MKVIFLEHVLHVAKAWEVKEVSSGYATNFLFPQKLAKPFTEVVKKQLTSQMQKKEAERRVLLWWKWDIIKQLEWQVFEFFLEKNTQNHKPLWAIKVQDIVSYISKKYHIPLQKKHIIFPDHIHSFKEYGDYEIYVDLWNNFAGKSMVRVSSK